MQRINLRHKLNLYRNKIVLLLIGSLLGIVSVQGQQLHSQDNFEWDTNLPHYDNRLLHYGFTLGLNSTRFRPVQSNRYFSDSLVSIRSANKGGFNLGFVVNLRLSKYFGNSAKFWLGLQNDFDIEEEQYLILPALKLINHFEMKSVKQPAN